MERTVPSILGKIQDKNEETAKQIRSMPDFVVQNINNGKLDYVEVKYRKNGRFGLKDLIEDYPYKNAIFVIVSKKSIRAISFADLELGKKIPDDGSKLEEFKTFDLDKQLVWKYRQYAESFFDGVE